MKTLSLVEHEEAAFPSSAISRASGRKLLDLSKYVRVEAPSYFDDRWRLMSPGYIGFLPVDDDLALRIAPKGPIRNVFTMIDWAYGFRGFRLLSGMVDASSVDELSERLAAHFAHDVRTRVRRGLYATYVRREERAQLVRGRILFPEHVRAPWRVDLPCAFEELTTDHVDNQLLLAALRAIARSGLARDRAGAPVRDALKALTGAISLVSIGARDCVGRNYNRLNEDYAALHAQCRFFLEHLAPGVDMGENASLPFLIKMSGLFEKFVAAWLEERMPPGFEVKAQEVELRDAGELKLYVDLVIYGPDRKPRIVLDTKYKRPEPTAADRNQVVAYATAKGCREAVLVYPFRVATPWSQQVGPVAVRALSFELDGDLERAGDTFLQQLGLVS